MVPEMSMLAAPRYAEIPYSVGMYVGRGVISLVLVLLAQRGVQSSVNTPPVPRAALNRACLVLSRALGRANMLDAAICLVVFLVTGCHVTSDAN